MAIPENVYVVSDSTHIIEICTVKAAADATAENHRGSDVQEHKLTKGVAKRAADAGPEGTPAPKKSKKGQKNTVKAFEGVPKCLAGKSFFFAGTGMKLTHKALKQTVTNHGGTVADELDEAENVVIGKKVGDGQQKIIDEKGLVTINEDAFQTWVESGDEPAYDDI